MRSRCTRAHSGALACFEGKEAWIHGCICSAFFYQECVVATWGQTSLTLSKCLHFANIGDAETLIIHLWRTAHQRISDKGKTKDGVTLSLGLEHIDDIIHDFEQGFVGAYLKPAKGWVPTGGTICPLMPAKAQDMPQSPVNRMASLMVQRKQTRYGGMAASA